MDDDVDAYERVISRKALLYVYPGKMRIIHEEFSKPYRISIQSLDPPLYGPASNLIETTYSIYDVLCGHMKVYENKESLDGLVELMMSRINEGKSFCAIKLETQKLMGVLVQVERIYNGSIWKRKGRMYHDSKLLWKIPPWKSLIRPSPPILAKMKR